MIAAAVVSRCPFFHRLRDVREACNNHRQKAVSLISSSIHAHKKTGFAVQVIERGRIQPDSSRDYQSIFAEAVRSEPIFSGLVVDLSHAEQRQPTTARCVTPKQSGMRCTFCPQQRWNIPLPHFIFAHRNAAAIKPVARRGGKGLRW
jgi:hypothetical protein